jgi:hypothetical protein
MKYRHYYSYLLTEKLNIPAEYNNILKALRDYIIGICLFKYTKNRIKIIRTKKDKEVVTLTFLYRKAKEFIENGKRFFSYREISGVVYHEHNFFLRNKNIAFPYEIRVKYSDGRVGGFGSYNIDDNRIELQINDKDIITDYNQVIPFIDDLIEHEVRHFLQFKYRGAMMYGTPKKQINKGTMQHAKPEKNSFKRFIARGVAHQYRPMEFKTNVHTFANSIKYFLNLNYKKSDWKKKFIYFFVQHPELDPHGTSYNPTNYGPFYYTKNEIYRIKEQLNALKLHDNKRWKQYIKEIYMLLFPT